MSILKEFFGFGGFQREAEGYFSWQHLTFVTVLVVCMTILAVWLGRRNRIKAFSDKLRVLMISAVVIDALEIFKLVIFSAREHNPWGWVTSLPLFLCSIQLITIPLAAFSKGRVQESALDFVSIFGLLGAILGTYAAGNIYSCYPVLSFDIVVSGVTHVLSGFCSLYILISGLASMKKKNIGITFAILLFFCVAAYIANIFQNCNYMFLQRGDGTPYDIVYNLVGGNAVLYPLSVVALFLLYIVAYYGVFYWATKRAAKKVCA